jgi:hypothetical protein
MKDGLRHCKNSDGEIHQTPLPFGSEVRVRRFESAWSSRSWYHIMESFPLALTCVKDRAVFPLSVIVLFGLMAGLYRDAVPSLPFHDTIEAKDIIVFRSRVIAHVSSLPSRDIEVSYASQTCLFLRKSPGSLVMREEIPWAISRFPVEI